MLQSSINLLKGRYQIMKNITYYSTIISLLFLSSNIYAANIYVDKTLSSNCTSGNYSTSNRNCSGNDGNAYRTIQAAIDAMSPGDHIFMRGGTYQPSPGTVNLIRIPTSKNGSSWSEGNYNKLTSYPEEWAIIDGRNNCGNRGVALGNYQATYSGVSDLKYWIFEKFEVKNARSPDGAFSWGIFASGGPNKFRYLYMHDCHASSGGNNPAGLSGYHWQGSTVEYCYLYNNGTASSTEDNPCNIMTFSDYHSGTWCTSGFDPSSSSYRAAQKNEIRYNYLVGSSCGYKVKGYQCLADRTPWQDTYDDYGDKIHHNIFLNARKYAIVVHQDFAQVYNNIIVGGRHGVTVNYQPDAQHYKVVVYNNTMINTLVGIVRYGSGNDFGDNGNHYGWDYNNILDGNSSYSGYCTLYGLNPQPAGPCGNTYTMSNYHNAYNYFYRSGSNNLMRMNDTTYTASGFESQSYYQYMTNGNHYLEGSKTIANGGIGGSHPYLAGVIIPSYVGATDPNNDSWVNTVLNLVNLADNIPEEDPVPGPPAAPTGLRIVE